MAIIRQVFVNEIRAVAEVDVDDAGDRIVYRDYFDHGGMSGGSIDLAWWRTKGLPLLVERAVHRRPQSTT